MLNKNIQDFGINIHYKTEDDVCTNSLSSSKKKSITPIRDESWSLSLKEKNPVKKINTRNSSLQNISPVKKIKTSNLSLQNTPLITVDGHVNKELCLLRQYLFRVGLKGKAHKLAEKWYLKTGRILGFPPILTSTLCSILGGLDISENKSSENKSSENIPYNRAVLCFSGLTLMLTGINKYLDYGQRASQHHNSSSRYSDMESNIELFLSTNFSKTDLALFLVAQHEKLDIFETLEPVIPDMFITQVKKKTIV
jgi:hypothetical protein